MDNENGIEKFKNYGSFLKEVKTRIQMAQIKANFAVNRELILLYWNIGKMVCSVQDSVGWGQKVIPMLSQDIKNDLPEIKGFSVTNIKRMTQFYREYSHLDLISPQAVGQNQETVMTQFQHLVTGLPWGHNILLMEKIKDNQKREWYMKQCLEKGWSRNILDIHIQNQSYEREGSNVSPVTKIATKARRHEGSPRGFYYKRKFLSWCSLEPWCLNGKNFHCLRVKGHDESLYLRRREEMAM